MSAKARILIVNDDRVVRSLVGAVLRRHGYAVVEAAHLDEALALVETPSEPIDLLLADAAMPHANGFELAQRLRTRGRTRMLLMSRATDDAVRHALSRTRWPFLLKPFTHDDVLEKVREALETDPVSPDLLAADLDCPSCGTGDRVEIVGVMAGMYESDWRYCQTCRHLWAVTAKPDPFPLLVGNPEAVGHLVQETCPPGGIPRAPRYRVALPVSIRVGGAPEWRSSVLENVSRSGALLRLLAPTTPPPQTPGVKAPVDLRVPWRTSAFRDASLTITGHGQSVRTVPASLASTYRGLALAVERFHVVLPFPRAGMVPPG